MRRQPRSSGRSTVCEDGKTDNGNGLIQQEMKVPLTVHWDQVEPWQRDNQYILTGYRPQTSSFGKCAESVFGYVHNQSINIWTHLFGAILFVVVAGMTANTLHTSYPSSSRTDVQIFGCFFVGVVLCLGTSATYHTVCCHSDAVSKIGNKLDYLGIVFLTVGSFVPSIHYGFFCHPHLKYIYWTMVTSLGAGCVGVSVLERFRSPAWRPYRAVMFIVFGLSGVIPVTHAMQCYDTTALLDQMGLNFVLLQGGFYISGACIYALRYPERLSPGTFDIYGNSHQLFHCLVVMAAVTQYIGLLRAYKHLHGEKGGLCSP